MTVASVHASPFALPLMERQCGPELLDRLPVDAPESRLGRRDLRRLNRLMGNAAWFARQFRARVDPTDRALEIGAGDGALAQHLDASTRIDALDLAPRPANFPPPHAWHREDARAFRGWQDYSIVLGNLVWHHFTDGELRRLGAAFAPHVHLLLACEPHRSTWARWLFRTAARVARLSLVTRHDGAVSIAAGFRRDELPRLLGLEPRHWRCRVTLTARGAYRLVAEKRR